MATQARAGFGHIVSLAKSALPEWWPVLAGLLVLFGP
ncbi:MAG: hypothetical protein JWQ01_1729, partial [Massilia sp.]|nr:hypothetical protein [Massilia sp.]